MKRTMVQSWRKPSLKGLGLVVNATQATVESDSFNNTYDENAATTLSTVSYSSGQHNITGKIQANGGLGQFRLWVQLSLP